MKINQKILVAATVLLLAGCDRNSAPTQAPPKADDPAVSAALSDPIMTDPELSGQDMGMVGVIASDSDLPVASAPSPSASPAIGAVNSR